jgi:transposase
MDTTSLVSDDLWEAIEPLLPKEPPKPKSGRPRVSDRAALGGIVFVLRTGCPWRLVPNALGCGSSTTCWRRLRDWQKAGVWQRLHETVHNWLGDAAAIDWCRASVDSLSVRAKRGASRRDETRSTAASVAPSTTSSLTAAASRWLCGSRPPTRTTPPSSSRLSMRFHPSSDHGESQGDLADALPSCTPTKPTIPRASAVPCTSEASPRASHNVASTLASGSVATAGWQSARSLGCSAFAASGCATSGALTCSKVCSTWPAPWCACASLVPWTGDLHGSSASMLSGLTAATLAVRWCTTATTGGLD